jgi:hypothetical protein
MFRLFIFAILACGLAVAGSGCCGFNGLACQGSMGACGGSCGGACGTPGGCGPAAVGCGECADDCGGACDTGCDTACDTGCYPCGPLSLIMKLANHNTWCGSGCGEKYWGGWHGDPPDCCDPCDRCGNWTGPGQTMQASHTGQPVEELQTMGRAYSHNRR